VFREKGPALRPADTLFQHHNVIENRGKNMFKPQDIVQSKTGGPKLVVQRVEGDTLWCTRQDDFGATEIEIKAATVSLYHEEGDFGVC
jgi:uncharacterized protein YodC (DUF2158 family)